MDKTLRSILWILVILVCLSSFSAGWFFLAKERLYTRYVDLEKVFKTKVEEFNNQIASFKRENKELNSKLKMVEKELAMSESKNRDLESKYQVLLKEREGVEREIARLRKGKVFLEKKLEDVESGQFLAGLLKEKVSLEVELNRMKDSLEPKDSEIERLRSEKTEWDNIFSRVKDERDLLKRKLEDSTKVAEILSKDFLEERALNKNIKLGFKNVEMEKDLLRNKVQELEEAVGQFKERLAKKEDIELQISKMERVLRHKDEEIDKLKIALERQSRSNAELRAEAYHTPDEVDLPPIVLQRERYDSSGSTSSPVRRVNTSSLLKGKVLTVNREHNFVVIDLGRLDGVDGGSMFDVYRSEEVIGYIEVIQTRERISACDIKDRKMGFSIEIDDLVMQR
ncbi:MAG: hypothetical protein KJ952_07165 [Candidatus Omnitrophica bacterium]|nr:hypothetical protein [Candidatus Omnitrophota bacterium]